MNSHNKNRAHFFKYMSLRDNLFVAIAMLHKTRTLHFISMFFAYTLFSLMLVDQVFKCRLLDLLVPKWNVSRMIFDMLLTI